MTETKGYRFKLPPLPIPDPYWETTSFGIEPYGINAQGREVKTGKAIIRIIMYRVVPDVDLQAGIVAHQLCQRLNNGVKYFGPKVIHLDIRDKYSLESLSAMFKP